MTKKTTNVSEQIAEEVKVTAEVDETPVAEVDETPVAEVDETPVAEVEGAEVDETPVVEEVKEEEDETPVAEVEGAEVDETPVVEEEVKEEEDETPVAEVEGAEVDETPVVEEEVKEEEDETPVAEVEGAEVDETPVVEEEVKEEEDETPVAEVEGAEVDETPVVEEEVKEEEDEVDIFDDEVTTLKWKLTTKNDVPNTTIEIQGDKAIVVDLEIEDSQFESNTNENITVKSTSPEIEGNVFYVEANTDVTITVKSTSPEIEGTVLYTETFTMVGDYEFVVDSSNFLELEDNTETVELSVGERIEEILKIKNYYSHLVCGRYFEGVGLTKESLSNFYCEFGAYCTDALDIELYKLLDDMLSPEA